MKVAEINSDLESVDDPKWDQISSQKITLTPIPLDGQPNSYIKLAWKDRPYGLTPTANLAVARNKSNLFTRLEWNLPTQSHYRDSADVSSESNQGMDGRTFHTEFLDGVGIFFPLSTKTPTGDRQYDSPPTTIGTRDEPVRLWRWQDRLAVQADLPAIKEVLATGPGVFRPFSSQLSQPHIQAEETNNLRATSLYEQAKWAVVISAELDNLSLPNKMGLVIWNGSNDERAGIAAVCSSWIDLDN